MNAKILVVDDEPAILELIGFNLKKEGHEVVTAPDGQTGLRAFRQEKPDLVILDVMLPGMDGFDVCRGIRLESKVPVLMLTAKKDEIDRVVGLEIGADDYVTKPFSPRELTARVKALLRRSSWTTGVGPTGKIKIGDLLIDLDQRQVTVRGEQVSLTYTEFELLKVMAESPGRVHTRESLLEQIYGNEYYGDVRTVDVHVRHLREKLERNPIAPELIHTVRGVGYRFGGKG